MKAQTTERNKRIFKRVFFSIDDEVTAQVCLVEEPDNTVPAILLNISEGGVNIWIDIDQAPPLGKGDKLRVKSVNAPKPIGLIEEAEVEVRYVLRVEGFRYFSLGCAFIKLDALYRCKIHRFVKESFSHIHR